MRSGPVADAQKAKKRKDFLEKSFELFTKRNIDTVSMLEVARYCGYGTTTLYRYFSTKPKLVVGVATWRWNKFLEENAKQGSLIDPETMSAAEMLEIYLNAFLDLYYKEKDLLRFNQMFNIYLRSEHINPEDLKPYDEMISGLKGRFHDIYAKAQIDKTIRTDISEAEMLSTTLHLMLAVVTRYAVGLAYMPEKGYDEKKELSLIKEMLLKEYIV